MRGMIRSVGALIGVTLSTSAHAVWLHQTSEDPFQGDLQIAMTVEKPGYALGFRCRKTDDLDMLFVVPEKLERELADVANKIGLKMLVIVDKAPKVEMDTTMQISSGTEKATFRSEGPAVLNLLYAAQSAQKRVAVAIEMKGEIMHSVTFDVLLSTKALDGLISGCGLVPPVSN